MAKDMMSWRIDGDLRDALVAEALAERRSVGNMLEWILRERYSRGAALTERGSEKPDHLQTSSGGKGDNGDLSASPRLPRSVSAAVTPNDQNDGVDFVPPSTRTLPADKVMASFDRSVALRDGKCGADVAHGTKCKLCGKVH